MRRLEHWAPETPRGESTSAPDRGPSSKPLATSRVRFTFVSATPPQAQEEGGVGWSLHQRDPKACPLQVSWPHHGTSGRGEGGAGAAGAAGGRLSRLPTARRGKAEAQGKPLGWAGR